MTAFLIGGVLRIFLLTATLLLLTAGLAALVPML